MSRGKLLVLAAAAAGAVLALGLGVVLTAPDTALPWSVFGGGGTTSSSSASYRLGATAGQPAIGGSQSTNFRLGADFWYGAIPDKDADGVPDTTDNCPDTANAGQQNNVHPGTPAGDHCEDPEPDGVFDISDNCPDTANAGQQNADGDKWGDACETADCIAVYTLWVTPAGDQDCDGWTAADEAFVGTDPVDPCPDNTADNAWPPDFNNDTHVNIADINILKPAFFFSAPGPPYMVRLDLNADTHINIVDINRLKPVFFLSCTP